VLIKYYSKAELPI